MSLRELVALLVKTQEEIYRLTGKNRGLTITVSSEDFVLYWREHRGPGVIPHYAVSFSVAPDVWIARNPL